MDTIGAFEAKTKLAELLDRVAAGEEVIITRHGVAVAKLVPAGQPSRADVAKVVEELIEFRAGNRLNEKGTKSVSIREMIDHGRR
jgi:prevent-host-death family protein